jgi:hypothetical protein
MQQTPESIATAIFYAGIGAVCIAGYLIHKTTMLDGLLRVAALVIHGDAS